MKKIFLFLFTSIFLFNAYAISEEQAFLVVQNFLKERNIDKNNSLSQISLQEVVEKDGITMFYIIDLGNKEGFVIVSASEFVSPIIGYSFDSEFEWQPAIQFYLDSFSKDILLEESSKNTPDVNVTQQWNCYLQEPFVSKSIVANEILPLITSRWNQDKFYNTYCPWDVRAGAERDYRVYNGCVALAAAQLMNYYRHPETGKNSVSYTPGGYSVQSVSFSQHTYHWDAMCDRATSYTNEIAKLAYHTGVSCNMGYSPGGSGAQTINVARALQTYFYYTGFSMSHGVDSVRIKNELNLLQPVLMSGCTGDPSPSCHAFLLDGYSERHTGGVSKTEYHFNWGWGGVADGYFTLETQTFKYDATIFLGLRPATNYPVQCQQYKRQTAFQGYITNGSTNQPYQSNPDCSWIIAAPGATRYNFSFSRLDTQEGIDIVTIYNGATKSAGVAAQFSGKNIPTQATTVIADSVLITFTSTSPMAENNNCTGFLMSYLTDKPQQKCGFTTHVTAPSGYITDGTKTEENYTPWTSCTWNLAPNYGTGFYGLFHEFDLRLGDFVDVYDATRSTPILWRRFDRYFPPTAGEVISIPFPKIQIKFITDNFDEGTGFKFQYFSWLGVNDHSLLDNLIIYPNPASDFIHLSFSSELTNQSITCRLIDLAGKEVYTTLFDYNSDTFDTQIPVAHISKGFYFLQLVTTTGISTSKIIIN